jgi:hypothetical protein
MPVRRAVRASRRPSASSWESQGPVASSRGRAPSPFPSPCPNVGATPHRRPDASPRWRGSSVPAPRPGQRRPAAAYRPAAQRTGTARAPAPAAASALGPACRRGAPSLGRAETAARTPRGCGRRVATSSGTSVRRSAPPSRRAPERARFAGATTVAPAANGRGRGQCRTVPASRLQTQWLPSSARRLGRARKFPSCFSPTLSIPLSRDVSAGGEKDLKGRCG